MAKVKKKVKSKIGHSPDGRFLPGFCPNPKGGPKKADSNIGKLEAAIARVETKTGKSLLDHFIMQAFKKDIVLIALMKKLIPDLKAIQVEGSLDRGGMTEEEAKQISQVFKKRFEAIIHAHR